MTKTTKRIPPTPHITKEVFKFLEFPFFSSKPVNLMADVKGLYKIKINEMFNNTLMALNNTIHPNKLRINSFLDMPPYKGVTIIFHNVIMISTETKPTAKDNNAPLKDLLDL